MTQVVPVRVRPSAPTLSFYFFSVKLCFILLSRMAAYFPILMFLIIGILVGIIPLVLGNLLATKKPTPAKTAPYECGFDPFGNARIKFDVRYYLIAILFIIFDLEIVFLFPWAITLSKIGKAGMLAMAVFLGLLVVGFIYEWQKGALEWE